MTKQILSWYLTCFFHCQNGYWENFQCSLRHLVGCIWPAGRTLPMSDLDHGWARYGSRGEIRPTEALCLACDLLFSTHSLFYLCTVLKLFVWKCGPNYNYCLITNFEIKNGHFLSKLATLCCCVISKIWLQFKTNPPCSVKLFRIGGACGSFK